MAVRLIALLSPSNMESNCSFSSEVKESGELKTLVGNQLQNNLREIFSTLTFLFFYSCCIFFTHKVNEGNYCDQLSREANCSDCGFHGICVQGAARISPWLQFALKTQRELQIDVPVNHVQVLGAHNSYNNRASGYGHLDYCHWPLREDNVCISLANQEFSFIDQLNMGIRHLEIDLWEYFGKIRMSHGNSDIMFGCWPWDKELTEGMKEISDWTRKSENRSEIIEIHFDDHTGDSHYWSINHAIKKYFGHKVLR